jgi:DNA-binding CsgD family transcriptional regulator
MFYDHSLSARQTQCLFYLSQGHTYKEIAREMSISPRTVEYYIEIIRDKTGCARKFELVSYYHQKCAA